MTNQSRILLFTGDGKGKTTAALGMALRAAGHGMRVFVLQFVKQDATGETTALESLANIEILQTGRGFIPPPDHKRFAEHVEAAQAGFARATDAIFSGQYDMVVLDEICAAVTHKLVSEKEVIELLRRLPRGMCLVLTGRDATPGLIDMADTVSEVRCVKHAFETGRPAQKGVER